MTVRLRATEKALFQSGTYHLHSCIIKNVEGEVNILLPLLYQETQTHQWQRYGLKKQKGAREK